MLSLLFCSVRFFGVSPALQAANAHVCAFSLGVFRHISFIFTSQMLNNSKKKKCQHSLFTHKTQKIAESLSFYSGPLTIASTALKCEIYFDLTLVLTISFLICSSLRYYICISEDRCEIYFDLTSMLTI